MARTEIRGGQVKDTSIGRSDLVTGVSGEAVVTKVAGSNRITVTYDGADAGTGDTVVNLHDHYYSTLYDLVTATAINWTNGNVQKRTNTADVTFTFTGGAAGGRYALVITQSGGAWVITWPASVKWMGGTVPTPSATGKKDIYTFLYDGTDYLGSAALNF
jgi:hypothetical protein